MNAVTLCRKVCAIGGVSLLLSATPLPAQEQIPRGSATAVIAEYETTEVRVLADGNALENKATGVFYRDKQGRIRREQGSTAVIADPVAKVSFFLDTKTKTARKLVPRIGPHSTQESQVSDSNSSPSRSVVRTQKEQASKQGTTLGTQLIEGVEVMGKEYVTLIPSGSSIGNRKPINQVLQVWYSEELQLPILTVVKNPISGEKTQRYLNIRKGVEPDSELFRLPKTYKLVEVETAGAALPGR